MAQPVRLLFTANDSIYRTGDFGVSWSKETITANPACNTSVTIVSLVGQPTQPNHLSGYAQCLFQSDDYVNLYLIEFHSEDGGFTWVQNPAPANSLVTPNPFNPVVTVDGNHPTTRYQVTYAFTNTQIGNGWQTFFQTSSDAGQTWGARQWLPFCGSYEDLVEEIEYLQLDWLVVHRGGLVLVCKQGLFHSVDQGKTWTRAPLEFGHGDFGFMADYGHPGRLLWERDTGLWASDDLGDTWTRLTQYYEANQFYLPHILRP